MTTPNASVVTLIHTDPKMMDSFKDGWLTGFTWPETWNHTPGGPWVYRNSFGENDPKRKQMATDSKNAHEAWLAGWAFGKAQQNRTWTVDEHVAASKAL